MTDTPNPGIIVPVKRKIAAPEIRPELLNGLVLTGYEDEATRMMLQVNHLFKSMNMVSLRPLLPLLFSLKGEPLTLKNHYPFEPFFRTRMPRRTLMMTGRQVGKCVKKDSLIQLANGHWIQACKIMPGDAVLTLGDDLRCTVRPVAAVYRNGIQPLLNIRTRYGSNLNVTHNHKLKTLRGYCQAGELVIGDCLAHLYRLDLHTSKNSGDKDIYWDAIESIASCDPDETLDIEIAGTHNYCLDGIISHNSSAQASRAILQSVITPFYSTLFITPLFEMIRRFSQNYVRPLIDQSPVKSLIINPKLSHSVLQRTFVNNAQMIFSFAFENADRTRGISCDQICIDELQDVDKDLIPIIQETMSGSKYGGIEAYSGTPKGLENTMEMMWNTTSQAQWVMKCVKCNYWNVPALSHDLDLMIGPWHEDISPASPGIVCASCRQPKTIFPHLGHWLHTFPDKRWEFSGLHVPQIIMPMHCNDPEKWSLLLAKRANVPTNVFYNEVCGESYDTGSRIVTLTDLRNAAVLPWSTGMDAAALEAATAQCDRYIYRVLGVDWGGGGQDGMSYTCYAVVGMLPDGRLECIWGHRSLTPHNHPGEAELALQIVARFKCHMLAHDYTGAGSLRETFIIQAGYPFDRVVNVSYVRAAATARIMTTKAPTKLQPRGYYQVDKARSLLLVCNQIKCGWLKFFQWDFKDKENSGLIYDFLALVDEKVDSRVGKDIYTIIRDPNMRDDFAQATNIACCTLWNMADKWPNVAAIASLQLDPLTESAIQPVDKEALYDW